MPGTLFHGDNTTALRRMAAGSVELAYADPPFRTKDIFRTAAGAVAYSDRWAWTSAEDALLEAQISQTNQDEQSVGPPLSDVWDIPVVAPSGHERTGYPTQKPDALLERVVLSFSNEGDTVLDPYCGSGTTLAVAEKHGRKWIGMDASDVAIETSLRRLGVAVRDVRASVTAR